MREIINMQRQQSFLTTLKWSAVVGSLLLGLALIQPVSAGCLDMSQFMKKTGFESQESAYGGRFVKMAWEESDGDEEFHHAAIVGLWAFKYVAEGNEGITNGTQIDGGNTLWFADGNEMTYSAIRNPTTGATCLGVWKQTGRYTYELNHIGISWDQTVTAPFGGSAGPAFIKQYVTLASDGKTYNGWFEINQLEKDGKTVAVGFPIKGKIEAVRVTVDTTTQTLPTSGNE
jgi:hypothetical protein